MFTKFIEMHCLNGDISFYLAFFLFFFSHYGYFLFYYIKCMPLRTVGSKSMFYYSYVLFLFILFIFSLLTFSFSHKKRYFKQNKNTFKCMSDTAQYNVCNISMVKVHIFHEIIR